METILGLFAKHPIPGKVKTRLAADLGANAAAKLYQAFLKDLTDRFATVAARRTLCFSPGNNDSALYFQDLSATRYELWSQPEAPLGERMERFFTDMLGEGEIPAEPRAAPLNDHRGLQVVLIGTDSPTLPVELVDEAFLALDTHDCVVGPATDGGFYLMGLTRCTPGLFDDVDWGSSRVLEQTVRNIAAQDFRLHLLPPWYDVDTLDDLHTLQSHLAAMHAAGQADVAPRTAKLMTWEGEAPG